MTKGILLAINNAYLFFGTTVYVGVLWALHFFWYPSWSVMNLGNVQDHFILPTSAATDFFTIVVPLMFLTNVILIVMERKTWLVWLAVVALLGITTSTVVGQVLIIPINETIAAGLTDPTELADLLQRWMFLNDVRWVAMTIMWLALMVYFIAKGDLIRIWNGQERPTTRPLRATP